MWGQIRSYGARNLTVEHVSGAHQPYVVVVQMHGAAGAESYVSEIVERYDLHVIPGSAGNVSMGVPAAEFTAPLYWQLPAQYAGDRLASYGGWLNFSVRAEGVDEALEAAVLESYPLVQLLAHSSLVLDYYGPQRMEALSVGSSDAEAATYAVGLNETFWRYRFSEQNVTRAIMLTALQDVKGILVRATAWRDFQQVV